MTAPREKTVFQAISKDSLFQSFGANEMYKIGFAGENVVGMSVCLPDFAFPRRLLRTNTSNNISAQFCTQASGQYCSGLVQRKKPSPKPTGNKALHLTALSQCLGLLYLQSQRPLRPWLNC